MKILGFVFSIFLICHLSFAKSKVQHKAKLNKQSVLEVQAQQEMFAIAKEIQDAKTVRQWIDKAPRDLKVFRRIHFSSRMNEAMPVALLSQNAIVIIPREKNKNGKIKERHLLEARVEKGKIQYYLNNRNISRQSKESMEQWVHRINGEKAKKRKTAFHWWIPAAEASPLNWDTEGSTDSSQLTYWSSIAASMTADQFRSTDLTQQYGFAALDTSDYAHWMAQDMGLSCDSDRQAHFDFLVNPPAGGYFRVQSFVDRKTNHLRLWINSHPNSGQPEAGQQVGRIAIPLQDGGRPTSINTFDHRNGGQELGLDNSIGMGWFMYALEAKPTANSQDNPNQASFPNNVMEYAPELKNLMVLADVASATCANQYLQQDSQVPSGSGTDVVQ